MLETPDSGCFSEDPRSAAQEVHLALRIFVAELFQRAGVAQEEQRLTDAEVAAVLQSADQFAVFYDSNRYVPSDVMVDAAFSGEDFEVEFPEEAEPTTLYRFARDG